MGRLLGSAPVTAQPEAQGGRSLEGNAPEDSSLDIVRQSVVILMGSLARHLDKDDPKVRPIIGKLIQALATPSLQV